METEQTIYDNDESTTLDEKETKKQPVDEPKQTESVKKTKPMWHTVTIGGVAGIVFGAVASGFKADAATTEQGSDDDNEGEDDVNQHDEPVVDGGVTEAASVNDDMSFSEAFASARAEVGPGGVFEWRGNLYGTYYATEWDIMTVEEKNGYNSRVSLRQQNHAPEEHTSDKKEVTVTASASTDENTDEKEVKVISTSLSDNGQESEDIEVEVLGVEHVDDSNMNVAYVSVEDQEVILIDATGDEEFDYMAADLNHDNQITSDEVVDISGYGINVDMMGGYTDNLCDNDLMADAGTFDV